jgi:uncharacterized membrane protein
VQLLLLRTRWIASTEVPDNFYCGFLDLSTYSFDGFGIYCFNMMVLNFANQLFLTYFTKQLLVIYLELFWLCVFAKLLNINTVIVGASAAIMTILVAVTYQPLMNVQNVINRNVKLWHITAVF